MKPDLDKLAESIEKAGKVQRVVEFQCPYIDEFYVKIAHANKFIMSQIIDFARETQESVVRRGQTQEIERLNEDLLRQGYAEWIVTGWRGLTVDKLAKLIPGFKAEGAESGEQEVPYVTKVAIALFKVSMEFETWVVGIATNLKNYTRAAKKKAKQLENLV